MQVQEHEFGKILRYERKKRNITQGKLTEMTGFTVRAISFWETGQREITIRNADVVAKALGISVIIGIQEHEDSK